MTGYIDRIRSASIGGQVTSVGGTPEAHRVAQNDRIDATTATVPAPQNDGPVPQGNGPRLSRALC